MQSSEKLCLKWNDFQENLTSAFQGLRNDQDFADVTLACEDGTQIETHKMILASSSPFFMEILKRNKHPHPMIYMRGLKAEALVAMVDFLYYGETNVNQESLDTFLGLAEELRLKGMTGASAGSNTEEFRNKAIPAEANVIEGNHHVKTTLTPPTPMDVYNSNNAKVESSATTLVSLELDQLDEQIKSMMTRRKNEIIHGNRNHGLWACNHIESIHIVSDITHPCDICGKVSRFQKTRSHNANFSRTKHNLRMYKSRSQFEGSTEIFFYN